jgi:uncharacterized protein YmfQ (DUF2313 family)
MIHPFLDEDRAPLHYNALKKLWPIKDLAGSFDDDLHIKGSNLDDAYYQNQDGLLHEIFPDEAGVDGLLPYFERIFALPGSGTEAQRQAQVVAAYYAYAHKTGRLSRAFFIGLGASMGYTVTITEGITDMFRCGTYSSIPAGTPIPHAVYESAHKWEWTIRALTVPVDARPTWERLVNQYRPAFTLVHFLYT